MQKFYHKIWKITRQNHKNMLIYKRKQFKEYKMKKNLILKVRLNDEMARKLSVVSEKERQTIQNEIIAMIRQKISYFERVKGNITREEINNANMEQFDEEN